MRDAEQSQHPSPTQAPPKDPNSPWPRPCKCVSDPRSPYSPPLPACKAATTYVVNGLLSRHRIHLSNATIKYRNRTRACRLRLGAGARAWRRWLYVGNDAASGHIIALEWQRRPAIYDQRKRAGRGRRADGRSHRVPVRSASGLRPTLSQLAPHSCASRSPPVARAPRPRPSTSLSRGCATLRVARSVDRDPAKAARALLSASDNKVLISTQQQSARTAYPRPFRLFGHGLNERTAPLCTEHMKSKSFFL